MDNEIKGFQDTIDWYNKNAEFYSRNIEDIANPDLLDKFAHAVGKGKLVLDAGCAAGRDTNQLNLRGLKAIGLDLSTSLLAIARKRYPNYEFKEGNFLDLPFEANTFDGIWAHASLLHLETTGDVIKALQEFYRTLKPGGILHVFVKQQLGDKKTSVVTDKLSGHDRFFQWFKKEEMRNLMQIAQFSIQEIEDNISDPGGRNEVKWIRVLSKK